MEQGSTEEKVRNIVSSLPSTGLSAKDISLMVLACQNAQNEEIKDYALYQFKEFYTQNYCKNGRADFNISEEGVAAVFLAIAKLDNLDKAKLVVHSLHDINKLSRTSKCGDIGIPKAIAAIGQTDSLEVAQAAIDSIKKIEAIYHDDRNISTLGIDYPYSIFTYLLKADDAAMVKGALQYMEKELDNGVKLSKLPDSVFNFIHDKELQTNEVERKDKELAIHREEQLILANPLEIAASVPRRHAGRARAM